MAETYHTSLSNRHRPHDWESVVGQEYTKTILRNALASGRVGTGYIFHGTRGTGKTTSARILAEGINCLDLREGNPCHVCANCIAFENESFLDVIEIDAASNTGVDNIRELIDTARFQPNQGKYKVYIIDEVHMLSKGAFNALLKILEEPPDHVKFILATTEIEKVPETIRSRTQRFDFRRIPQEHIADQLERICQAEGISADRTALMLIARLAKGALRDAITLLEQNRVNDAVTREHIMHTLSMVDEAILRNLISVIETGNIENAKKLLDKLRSMHVNVRVFLEEILFFLRDRLYEEEDSGKWKEGIRIFDAFSAVYEKLKYSPDTFLLFEITVLRLIHTHPRGLIQENVLLKSPAISSSQNADPQKTENPPPSSSAHAESIPVTKTSSEPFSFVNLVNRIRDLKPALATDLKGASFSIHEKTLVLSYEHEWRRERVETPEHRSMIQESLSELFGEGWRFQSEVKSRDPSIGKAVDEIFPS